MRLSPTFRAFVITILFAIIITSHTDAATMPFADGFSKNLHEAANELTKDISLFKGKKVAVGAIRNHNKNISNYSFIMHDYLTVELESNVNVVSRSELIEEVSKWLIGTKWLVNEDNVIQAGKLLGIDYFCFGDYTLKKDKGINSLVVNLRLVDSRTGETVSTATPKVIPIGRKPHYKEITNKKLTVSRATSTEDTGIKIEVWTEKEEYKDGDSIKFFVRAESDCFLTLIHADALGNLTKLFPNHYDPSNAVDAGKEYAIPSESAGFDFIASEPYGYEIIRAIASKDSDIDIKDVIGAEAGEISEENPFAAFITLPESDTKDPGAEEKKEWTEAVIKIRIRP